MKRTITKSAYDFLNSELTHLEGKGHLYEGQSKDLMDLYDTPKVQPTAQQAKQSKTNPIQILSIIGAILIGLGILSFVASNWSEMTKALKFSALLLTLIVFYLSAFSLEKKKPHLSKAFYYIGAFTYGAEIFYIGQMFHLDMKVEDALIIWGIGLVPLALYLKDNILKVVSLVFIYAFIEIKYFFGEGSLEYAPILVIPILFAFGYYIMKKNPYILLANFILLFQFIEMQFVFGKGSLSYAPVLIIPMLFLLNYLVMNNRRELTIANFVLLYQYTITQFIYKPIDNEQFPYVLIILLPILFYIGHKVMKKSQALFIPNLILALLTPAIIFNYFELENVTLLILFYFITWMVLTYIQHPDYKYTMRLTGYALSFPTALILSFPMTWESMLYANLPFYDAAPDNKTLVVSVIFSILYVAYALTLVNKNSLYGVAIVCIFILRFYVDLSLGFMDKSIAFIVGGILLLALGLWFEKTRRKEVDKDE